MYVLQICRGSEETAEPEAWVNAFLGRTFWDFLGEKYWANVVSKKIQMKLSKIRVGSILHTCTTTLSYCRQQSENSRWKNRCLVMSPPSSAAIRYE